MISKAKITAALKQARESSKERKFVQSIDLIITLKDFAADKEAKIEEFIQLPHAGSKKAKICALVGAELKEAAEKACDKVIISNDFPKWSHSRKARILARQFDFFIAQADMMPQIAQYFGKYFGPINKMPNPKAGSIVPSSLPNLSPVANKLRGTTHVVISKVPLAQCSVGDEKIDDAQLADNIVTVVDRIEHALPKGKNNINKILVKTTMGGSAKVE